MVPVVRRTLEKEPPVWVLAICTTLAGCYRQLSGQWTPTTADAMAVWWVENHLGKVILPLLPAAPMTTVPVVWGVRAIVGSTIAA